MAKKNANFDLQKQYNIVRSKIFTQSENAQPLIKFVTNNYTTYKKDVKIFSLQVNQCAFIANSKSSVDAANFISMGNIKLDESNQVTNNQGNILYFCYY